MRESPQVPKQLTHSQALALGKLQKELEEIRDGDLAATGQGIKGLPSRSILLEGARGTGKTSVLMTLRDKTDNKQDFCWCGDPIELRAFGPSDWILMTLLVRARNARLGTDDEIDAARQKERDKPGSLSERERAYLERVRSWDELLKLALRSHREYGRFVTANSASEPELRGYLQKQTSGTDSLRESFATLVRPDLGSPMLVFTLDDLDLHLVDNRDLLWEAMLEIDRYLAVPGTVFLFTADPRQLRDGMLMKYRSQRSEEALAQEETTAFLEKYFPRDARALLRPLSPKECLDFEVGGESIRGLLRKSLTPKVVELFDSGVHAERLPSTPRRLRAFDGLLRKEGEGLLAVAIAIAKAAGDDPLASSLAGIQERSRREMAESQLGLLVQAVSPRHAAVDKQLARAVLVTFADQVSATSISDRSAQRLTRVDQRDWLTQRLSPLPTIKVVGDNPSDGPYWAEFLYDLALVLDENMAWEVFIQEGLHTIVEELASVQVEEGLRGLSPLDRWIDDREGRSAVSLMYCLPTTALMLPGTLRGMFRYVGHVQLSTGSNSWYNKLAQFESQPLPRSGTDTWKLAANTLALIHVEAILVSFGITTIPSAPTLGLLIDQMLKVPTAFIEPLPPEARRRLIAFLELNHVRGLLPPTWQRRVNNLIERLKP